MLVTMAFGLGALLVLLGWDLLQNRLLVGPTSASAGERIVQAARVFGYFLFAATLASSCRHGVSLIADLGWMAVFLAVGVLAVELATRLGWATLPGLDAALGDNLAAATAAAAHRLAVAILAANVFGGTSFAELGIAFASFAVGQVSLLLLLWLFRRLTSYDDTQQILGGNVAAALSHGGLAVALALLIAYATDGEYVGALPALRDYGLALAEGLLVYPLRQVVVQCVVLRSRPTLSGGELDRAIGERGDVGAGALEAATYVAVALFVRSLA